VTIRLAPVLPSTVAIAQFPSVKHATSAVQEILQTGVGIQCVELVDGTFMKAANNYGVSSGTSSLHFFILFSSPKPGEGPLPTDALWVVLQFD
jgi:D-lactate dehydrogenase (cytochrome)